MKLVSEFREVDDKQWIGTVDHDHFPSFPYS